MKRRARVLAAMAAGSLLVGAMVAGGGLAQAVTSPGPVFSWGLNGKGQLGDDTQTSHGIPGPVCAVGASAPCSTQLANAVAVDAGDDDTSVAVLSDSSVVAWGENANGAIGDGTTTRRLTPVPVCAVGQSAPCSSFLSGVTEVSSGRGHVLALLTNGTVVGWGDNSAGQLGDGTTTNSTVPVAVASLTGVVAIAAGEDHSLAVLTNGTVVAWGNNSFGQLGDGTTTSSLSPVAVCAPGQTAPCGSLLSDVVSLGSGTHNHSIALTSTGAVYSWGRNGNGELGDGTQFAQSVPVPVCAVGQTAPCSSFLTGIAVAGGSDDFSMALASNGTVYTWGNNVVGQLGDGTTTRRLAPVQVCALGQTAPCSSFLTGATAINAGSDHSIALAGGTVYAWGYNAFGQLGDGTSTDASVPVRVCAVGQTAPCSTFLSNIVAVAAGGDHNLAIGTPPAADLQVRMSASSSLLNPMITYTVRATNHGPGSAQSGTVTVRLSPATTSAFSTTCTYNASAKTATCPVGSLVNGATASHTIRAAFTTLTVGLPLAATAARTSSTPNDPNLRNDSAASNCAAVTSLIILC